MDEPVAFGEDIDEEEYDIYFDYIPTENDPYVDFISPIQDEQIIGDVQVNLEGSADAVELWLDGNLLTIIESEPFEYLWQPESGLFILKAVG